MRDVLEFWIQLHSHTEIEISFKFIPKILMSKECIHFFGPLCISARKTSGTTHPMAQCHTQKRLESSTTPLGGTKILKMHSSGEEVERLCYTLLCVLNSISDSYYKTGLKNPAVSVVTTLCE
jgi:hypothetical protein